MDDLISRQAAIDALEERLQANGYSNVALVSELNRIIGYLMRLPSAQPEIIRCKECKYWFDIDDGRQKHRMCADFFAEWFCADAERRTDERSD